MRHPIFLSLLLACNASAAETPEQILESYAADAARRTPGFKPNAGLGEFIHIRARAINSRGIRPLATAAGANLSVDPARVEQRFTCDCMEVLGRECSAGEKADLLAYLTSGD